jgi:hypothetical protein
MKTPAKYDNNLQLILKMLLIRAPLNYRAAHNLAILMLMRITAEIPC